MLFATVNNTNPYLFGPIRRHLARSSVRREKLWHKQTSGNETRVSRFENAVSKFQMVDREFYDIDSWRGANGSSPRSRARRTRSKFQKGRWEERKAGSSVDTKDPAELLTYNAP
jgi:hypothetical protein